MQDGIGSVSIDGPILRKPDLFALLEPTHNARFQSLMDQHHPKWRSHRETLNRLPVRHESWG